ncbi:MAG: hypothetical protein ACHQT7_01890 [Candidatus Levyibacteriota bacterium]
MIKNLVYLSIFTTFVVLVWIFLNIYHALTFSTVTKDVNIQITPLDSTFNTSVISSLQKREQIPVDFTSSFSTSPSASPAIIPLIKPTGTPSAQIGTPSAGLTPTTSGGSTPNL